jgi:mono/diheme cytochrome c family protein
MRSNTATPKLIATTGALIIAVGHSLGSLSAQESSAKDNYQRSLQIYEFKKAAPRGPARGQEIFYYKCWFCHNEFTKDIPKLTGLFGKSTLISGEPVNDDTVKEKIRNGGPGMAAYKYTLRDADVDDLVSYLREKCCWDSDAPPSNPRYRAP